MITEYNIRSNKLLISDDSEYKLGQYVGFKRSIKIEN